jgi:hypothetical protein
MQHVGVGAQQLFYSIATINESAIHSVNWAGSLSRN